MFKFIKTLRDKLPNALIYGIAIANVLFFPSTIAALLIYVVAANESNSLSMTIVNIIIGISVLSYLLLLVMVVVAESKIIKTISGIAAFIYGYVLSNELFL